MKLIIIEQDDSQHEPLVQIKIHILVITECSGGVQAVESRDPDTAGLKRAKTVDAAARSTFTLQLD